MGRLDRMQDKVEWVLGRYPQTRDNDRLLICVIYRGFYNADISHISFKDLMLDDTLPNFETIRRCRQKAQADNPGLRGKRDRERLERQREYVEYANNSYR